MRPNPLIARAYLARGALLWIGVRALVSLLLVLGGTNPVRLTFAATTLILGGTLALGIVDLYRRHELALLENLAVSRTAITFFLVGPAILGELGILLAASVR